MNNIIKHIRKFPYVLAPLAGYSDHPFRLLAAEYGASLVFTEMVNVHSIIRAEEKIQPLLFYSDKERPVGLQLFGNDSARFYEAAKRGAGLGFDLVDINFGCPVKKVIKSKSGAYLHKDIKAVVETIKNTVKGAGGVPVSVKMRSGWDEEHINFLEIARAAEDNGVKILTLHPRTRSQMFKGRGNWEHIAEIKKKSGLFIIGNGDVKTAGDALEMKKQTGCDAVMTGRAAMGNPFIFREIADSNYSPSFNEKVDTAIRHLELLSGFKGKRGVHEMRKYYPRYIKGFAGVKELRKKLFSLESTGKIIKTLKGLKKQ